MLDEDKHFTPTGLDDLYFVAATNISLLRSYR
jgi:hypothetical protein